MFPEFSRDNWFWIGGEGTIHFQVDVVVVDIAILNTHTSEFHG
jgi:hypothetical protein